jgi:outer membrane protein assembly factor BamE (lipoprotein component of BamABCDE complex)
MQLRLNSQETEMNGLLSGNTMILAAVMTRALLLVVVVTSAITAHAARGVSISRSHESAVRMGMTAGQVREQLGPPAIDVKYRGAPGRTWGYRVIESTPGTVQFDVDFGADGKVGSAREHSVPSGG